MPAYLLGSGNTEIKMSLVCALKKKINVLMEDREVTEHQYFVVSAVMNI